MGPRPVLVSGRRPAARPPAPQAPRVGRSRVWLGRFHVTGSFWYRFHRWGVASTPAWMPALVVPVFAAFFFVTLRGIRAAIAGNLEATLGPCGWRDRQRRIWKTMLAFAWCLTERYENLCTDRPFSWEVEGREHWEALVRGNDGFIVVTAHVGNWEAASMLPVSLDGRTVHVVREDEIDPAAQALVRDLLERAAGEGYRTHFASDDPQLGVVLLDALRAGGIVALQGDRPRAAGRRVRTRLLGRPIELPAGPAALARAAGVPLLPAFVLREGRRRYRLVMRPPVRIEAAAGAGAEIEPAVDEIAREIGEIIRRRPEQWFCFARLWPEA